MGAHEPLEPSFVVQVAGLELEHERLEPVRDAGERDERPPSDSLADPAQQIVGEEAAQGLGDVRARVPLRLADQIADVQLALGDDPREIVVFNSVPSMLLSKQVPYPSRTQETPTNGCCVSATIPSTDTGEMTAGWTAVAAVPLVVKVWGEMAVELLFMGRSITQANPVMRGPTHGQSLKDVGAIGLVVLSLLGHFDQNMLVRVQGLRKRFNELDQASDDEAVAFVMDLGQKAARDVERSCFAKIEVNLELWNAAIFHQCPFLPLFVKRETTSST